LYQTELVRSKETKKKYKRQGKRKEAALHFIKKIFGLPSHVENHPS
jgi:hypothetical protein